MFLNQGVSMKPKAFAVGFRMEHPQRLIDDIQYNRWAEHEDLPAAYYEITTNLQDGPIRRGVYSFCMCPGGSVVPTPTHEGEVCVNGMSHAARSRRYANSAMVVTVEPSDFASFARSDDPVDRLLAGVTFQQRAEGQDLAQLGVVGERPEVRVHVAELPGDLVQSVRLRPDGDGDQGEKAGDAGHERRFRTQAANRSSSRLRRAALRLCFAVWLAEPTAVRA
jgi:hypothetical protein